MSGESDIVCDISLTAECSSSSSCTDLFTASTSVELHVQCNTQQSGLYLTGWTCILEDSTSSLRWNIVFFLWFPHSLWATHVYTPTRSQNLPSKPFVQFIIRLNSYNDLGLMHPVALVFQQKSQINCLCDRLCGLVVRVLDYRSGVPGSIPGHYKKK
jgi:uncharacterized metal-binding protein